MVDLLAARDDLTPQGRWSQRREDDTSSRHRRSYDGVVRWSWCRRVKTYDEVAGEVGYLSRGTAHRAVSQALSSRLAEDADHPVPAGASVLPQLAENHCLRSETGLRSGGGAERMSERPPMDISGHSKGR